MMAALNLVLFLGGAWLFEWLFRTVVARMQGRIGPGILQPLADLIKLMFKEDIQPSRAGFMFHVFPPLALAVTLLSLFLLPIGGFLDNEYSLLILCALLSIGSLIKYLAALSANTIYSSIGGRRLEKLTHSTEIPLLLSLLAVGIAKRELLPRSGGRAQPAFSAVGICRICDRITCESEPPTL